MHLTSRRKLTSRMAGGALGAAVAGAVLLAACGGSGTKHAAAPASAPAPATPTVTTKHDPKLGSILAEANGLTLYTLTKNGRAVDCTGSCASVWPPLVAPSGGAPTAGPDVTMLGTASLSDGTHVVTAGGLPVYRFAQDEDSGDVYGEGMSSFGGVWHVVHAGQSTAAASPTPTPAMHQAATTDTVRSTSGY